MGLGETATVVGGFATAAAAAFAGWQLLVLHRDRRADARAAIRGVAVAWHPVQRHHRPEPDGSAIYVYEITVANPGTLPISDVDVDLDFPVPVSRRHWDGVVDEPVTRLNMGTAVLLGGMTRTWKRELRLPFGVSMRAITATVSFDDTSGQRHTNSWHH